MKKYRGAEVYLHCSTLDEEWSTSHLGCFTPRENPIPMAQDTGPYSRSRLCGEKKTLLSLPGIEPLIIGRPVP
jgi:hypothetical protein